MSKKALKKTINYCERLLALNKAKFKFQKEKLIFEKA